MRIWFIVSTLLALSLAGCAGEADPETPTETEIPEGGTFEETGSAENATENNTIPTATLTVHVPAGFAPVDVQFNFSVDGFLDNQFVDWALDVDGDGVNETEGFGGLPGNYTQTFRNTADLNATFYAFDETHAINTTVAFSIIGAPVIPPTEQTFTGSWLTDDFESCWGAPLSQADLTFASMDVDPKTWGQSFFAGYDSGFLTANLDWLDESGAVIQAQADTDSGEFYEITGTVPENAATAIFYSCATNAPNAVAYRTPA